MKLIMKMELFMCFILSGSLFADTSVANEHNFRLYINGPSFTKHFIEYDSQFTNWHLGVGFELDFSLCKKNPRWLWGGHFHFMFNDSDNKIAYWGGGTLGYLIGKRQGFWFEPQLILGLMKKAEYFKGTLYPFGLLMGSVGYHRVALNFAFIPPIQDNPSLIMIIMVKYQII